MKKKWKKNKQQPRVSIITTVVSIRFILFRMYFYELTDPLLNLIYNFIVIVWFQFNAMETVLFALNIQTWRNRDRQRKGTSANVLVDFFFPSRTIFWFFSFSLAFLRKHLCSGKYIFAVGGFHFSFCFLFHGMFLSTNLNRCVEC